MTDLVCCYLHVETVLVMFVSEMRNRNEMFVLWKINC